MRQIARAAVVGVVVALILALLPWFAGGRGDAHEDAYDGGQVSLVGPSDSGLDGAGDLARRVRAAAFPDGGADYDDLARSLARPASHRSAPQTAALADDALANVDEVMGGLSRDRQAHVRTVGSHAELQSVYDDLARSGSPAERSGLQGTVIRRLDGSEIGIRQRSGSGGATIDIRLPDGTMQKVHIK